MKYIFNKLFRISCFHFLTINRFPWRWWWWWCGSCTTTHL